MTRKLTRGLSLASINLSTGQPISEKAEDLASALFVPLFLAKTMTRLFGNRGWNKLAKENNATAKMYDRPYELNKQEDDTEHVPQWETETQKKAVLQDNQRNGRKI